MNKTLEKLAFLNHIYDSYLKKNELSEAIQKTEFDFQEEETALAAQFNKDLILPDISSVFDDSLASKERENAKAEFMKEFDQFQSNFQAAKSDFDEECSKRKNQIKRQTQTDKNEYSRKIMRINDFLKSVPISQEYYDRIPELIILINEGAAVTIEEAISILSAKKNRFI